MPLQAAVSGISLTNASVAFSGREVLADITLSLTEQRIGIIGRNGSGKTTLLRLIAGLIPATSGSVLIDGVDPATDRKAALASVGILFQNPDHQILFPTVEEELAFGLRQQGQTDADARAKARDALEAEGRSHWANAGTHTLSQGQRHYLCLLSVLLMAPKTILLDEPFAGMDLPTIARITRRLAGLPQQIITISHDPTAVAACDRVIWLEAGRIAAHGPAAEVVGMFVDRMHQIGAQDADTDIAR